MNMSNRILLFTGDGKGKTTAALGMALRAAGHKMRTLTIQFVKSDTTTGEIAASGFLPGMEIIVAGRGFVPKRSNPEFERHREAADAALARAAEAMASGDYDTVILDEIVFAAAAGLLEEEKIIEAIRQASPRTTIVMTGRGATPGLIAIADTVSEIRAVKHGFESGRQAQKGVEY